MEGRRHGKGTTQLSWPRQQQCVRSSDPASAALPAASLDGTEETPYADSRRWPSARVMPSWNLQGGGRRHGLRGTLSPSLPGQHAPTQGFCSAASRTPLAERLLPQGGISIIIMCGSASQLQGAAAQLVSWPSSAHTDARHCAAALATPRRSGSGRGSTRSRALPARSFASSHPRRRPSSTTRYPSSWDTVTASPQAASTRSRSEGSHPKCRTETAASGGGLPGGVAQIHGRAGKLFDERWPALLLCSHLDDSSSFSRPPAAASPAQHASRPPHALPTDLPTSARYSSPSSRPSTARLSPTLPTASVVPLQGGMGSVSQVPLRIDRL